MFVYIYICTYIPCCICKKKRHTCVYIYIYLHFCFLNREPGVPPLGCVAKDTCFTVSNILQVVSLVGPTLLEKLGARAAKSCCEPEDSPL